jgi:hypothetical protein
LQSANWPNCYTRWGGGSASTDRSSTATCTPTPPAAPPNNSAPLRRCRWSHARSDVLAADGVCGHELVVGIDAPVHVPVHATATRFDAKMPGRGYVDLSGIRLDPRLPSPLTPTGSDRYTTPTLAYAVELGAGAEPFEAWIRPGNGPTRILVHPPARGLRDHHGPPWASPSNLTDQAVLDAMDRDPLPKRRSLVFGSPVPAAYRQPAPASFAP